MSQHVNIIKHINALIWYYTYAIKGQTKNAALKTTTKSTQ